MLSLPNGPIPDGTLPALLTRVDCTAYDVLTTVGAARVPALPSPADPLDAPTVGDWLALAPNGGHPGYTVAAVLPRSSVLCRGSAHGTSTAQALAANVEIVLICLGLPGPLPLRRLERLLTLAWESGATPVVVLTKADLCADLDQAVREAKTSAPGCDVVTVAAGAGDAAALAPYLSSTLVLLGASGSGKSTIVNLLVGSPVMDIGGVRGGDGKGRHTTTHRELVVLPTGGVIIDTPGLRGVALHAAEDGLAMAFADVEELAVRCRFADCGHRSEPDCAITTSVAEGQLDMDRVESWRKLHRELAFQERRKDARLLAEQGRQWRRASKQQRLRGARP